METTPVPVNVMVEGINVFGWRVGGTGTPAVYLHGNPTNADQWLPFLRRGGPAIALDLPGWGRSSKPSPSSFDYSMHNLDRIIHLAMEKLGVQEHDLIVQDWGSLALIGAQKRPELVRRLILFNCVPLLPGFEWHWIARWFWRRRGPGELVNATTTRSAVALTLRQARGDRRSMPREFVDLIMRYWDPPTSAAILALYRDADPERLAQAGQDLERLSMPALILWSDRDGYIPARFGELYAARLPDARLETQPKLGHWAWVEDPSLIDRVLEFLS